MSVVILKIAGSLIIPFINYAIVTPSLQENTRQLLKVLLKVLIGVVSYFVVGKLLINILSLHPDKELLARFSVWLIASLGFGLFSILLLKIRSVFGKVLSKNHVSNLESFTPVYLIFLTIGLTILQIFMLWHGEPADYPAIYPKS